MSFLVHQQSSSSSTFYKYYVDIVVKQYLPKSHLNLTLCHVITSGFKCKPQNLLLQPLMLGQCDLLAVHLLPAYKHVWVQRIVLYMH